MSLRNRVMLITYADSLGGNLSELRRLLDRHLSGAVGGLHLLPFFPSSADRGFAPISYDAVDERFGSWQEIRSLAERYDLAVDFMINHISRRSRYFADFLEHKDASPYAEMFIRFKDFWEGGEPSQDELSRIYKRKPRPPYVEVAFADGSREKIWCTFDDEQIDLDLRQEVTREFVRETLTGLADRGAALVRLDAFAYSAKRAGTSCFFVEPEVWEILDFARSTLEPKGVDVLPEIHEHYTIQLALAERGYWVYDFVLPMLLLHTLYFGTKRRLVSWLERCPRRQFTTLDTHDGIGVVDVKGILSDEEIDGVQDRLFAQRANVKRIYNTEAYNNLDIYQINCTYYSALGEDDQAYLLARAIQFFSPGIPQVYYVGLLAGPNDIELVERTRVGRDINRHPYTAEEVAREVERPVVRRLLELMRFRNAHPAFEGELEIASTAGEHQLKITRRAGSAFAELDADLRTHSFTIRYSDSASGTVRELGGV